MVVDMAFAGLFAAFEHVEDFTGTIAIARFVIGRMRQRFGRQDLDVYGHYLREVLLQFSLEPLGFLSGEVAVRQEIYPAHFGAVGRR